MRGAVTCAGVVTSTNQLRERRLRCPMPVHTWPCWHTSPAGLIFDRAIGLRTSTAYRPISLPDSSAVPAFSFSFLLSSERVGGSSANREPSEPSRGISVEFRQAQSFASRECSSARRLFSVSSLRITVISASLFSTVSDYFHTRVLVSQRKRLSYHSLLVPNVMILLFW